MDLRDASENVFMHMHSSLKKRTKKKSEETKSRHQAKPYRDFNTGYYYLGFKYRLV